MAPSTPPPALQRLIDFVNTHDPESGTDELSEPAALGTWLRAQDLLDDTDADAVGPADVRRAHEVREALRAVLVGNHEGEVRGELDDLNAVLGAVPLRIRVSASGDVALEPHAGGITGALGRLVAVIPAAAADGSWARTKACLRDTCQWAYYDSSRNRSRRWCSMDVCGNREKSRAFRERHAAD